MTISDIFILVIFVVEVIILAKLEVMIWKTLYTPLNILMLPYTVVLLITVALPKSVGFVDFYYPSIFFWIIGLLVFFIPSLLIGLKQSNLTTPGTTYESVNYTKPVILLITILLLLSFIHIFLTSGGPSSDTLGSDEYAEENLGGGLWGHIRVFLVASLILLIFLFDKAHWKYIFLIIGILVVAMLYQVKSWIIIPLVAGFLFRLYSKKMILKPTFVILFITSLSAIFFLSYYLLLVFAVDGDFTDDTFNFIYGNFLHYLTSGVNGLSIDMKAGFLEMANPEYIFAPILNIIYLFTGDELIIPISEIFHESGLGGTNVLTFFGTLYIHLGTIAGIFYVFFFSTLMYLLKQYIISTKCIYVTAIYIWWCSLLFMGWFDFYFGNLSAIEIPAYYLIFKALNKYIIIPDVRFK